MGSLERWIFEDVISIDWYIWTNIFPIVDLAGRDIHIICLAAPSDSLKPFLYHTGESAKNFWHHLMKDNPSHDDCVRATEVGNINRDGREAGEDASEQVKKCFNTNYAWEEEEGGMVWVRLRMDHPWKLCT